MKTLSAVLLFAAALSFAEAPKAPAPAAPPAPKVVMRLDRSVDWRKPALFTAVDDGALRVSMSAKLPAKSAFPVRASKRYRCTLKLRRAPGSGPSAFYLIFDATMDDGRPIRMVNVTAIRRTQATVVSAVAKGATTLTVRPALERTWSATYGGCVCFHAREDFSDLPNYAVSPKMKSVAQNPDGTVLVTLGGPLGFDVPAGTPARIHATGSNLYVIQVPQVPVEWTEYSGEVQGVLTVPDWTNKSFPLKTAWAAPAILANWGAKGTAIEIKDLRIEEL